MNTIAILSARLRQHRAATNLTQQDYATKLGVDVTTFGRWERGDIEPPLDRVVAIAQLMGCTTDYLLGLSSTPTMLSPGMWLVDMDVVEAVRSGKDVSGAAWSAVIPEHHRIVSSVEFDRLRREVEHPLPRRKKRP